MIKLCYFEKNYTYLYIFCTVKLRIELNVFNDWAINVLYLLYLFMYLSVFLILLYKTALNHIVTLAMLECSFDD